MYYQTKPSKKRVAFQLSEAEHAALAKRFPYLADANDRINWKAAVRALLADQNQHQQGRVTL